MQQEMKAMVKANVVNNEDNRTKDASPIQSASKQKTKKKAIPNISRITNGRVTEIRVLKEDNVSTQIVSFGQKNESCVVNPFWTRRKIHICSFVFRAIQSQKGKNPFNFPNSQGQDYHKYNTQRPTEVRLPACKTSWSKNRSSTFSDFKSQFSNSLL